MKTNLEKWNHYLSSIKSQATAFIEEQKKGKYIPETYYVAHPAGKVSERKITGFHYSHYRHNGKTFFYGKKPTRADVEEIRKYANSEIPFSVDNIYFDYSEAWDKENNRVSTSSVKFNDVINEMGLFYSYDEAKAESEKMVERRRLDKEFNDLHKKGSNYDYRANGYEFLGWQNGWKHEYFDEDGNLCSETGKPSKSFGYSKENYPKYRNCIDSGHRRINVSHNSRGSENTVSCPACKIYWKYDCSD